MTDWEEEKQQAIRATEIPSVITDGKVYFSAEHLADTFKQTAGMMMLRSMMLRSSDLAFVSEGIGIAGDFIGEMNSEILRRVAVAMYAAGEAEENN